MMRRVPLDTGGTSIDSNVSTPLKLNEEKLEMADLPGQLSVGDLVVSCPVVRTELNENEAELSVIGGDAVQSKSVGDFDSQLPSQHEALINTSTRSRQSRRERI